MPNIIRTKICSGVNFNYVPEEKFKNFFQTKVEIKHANNKGKIILEYYSNDELERILEIVNGR